MPLSRKVWEFMVKEPPTVAPADSILRALTLLKQLRDEVPGVQSLIVADPNTGQLKGVITLRRMIDGLRKAVGRIAEPRDVPFWERPEAVSKLRQEAELVKVKDVMSKNIYQVKPYDSLSRAMEMMLDKRVRGVPVVESGRVIGVIRMNDIYTQFYQQVVGQD